MFNLDSGTAADEAQGQEAVLRAPQASTDAAAWGPLTDQQVFEFLCIAERASECKSIDFQPEIFKQEMCSDAPRLIVQKEVETLALAATANIVQEAFEADSTMSSVDKPTSPTAAAEPGFTLPDSLGSPKSTLHVPPSTQSSFNSQPRDTTVITAVAPLGPQQPLDATLPSECDASASLPLEHEARRNSEGYDPTEDARLKLQEQLHSFSTVIEQPACNPYLPTPQYSVGRTMGIATDGSNAVFFGQKGRASECVSWRSANTSSSTDKPPPPPPPPIRPLPPRAPPASQMRHPFTVAVAELNRQGSLGQHQRAESLRTGGSVCSDHSDAASFGSQENCQVEIPQATHALVLRNTRLQQELDREQKRSARLEQVALDMLTEVKRSNAEYEMKLDVAQKAKLQAEEDLSRCERLLAKKEMVAAEAQEQLQGQLDAAHRQHADTLYISQQLTSQLQTIAAMQCSVTNELEASKANVGLLQQELQQQYNKARLITHAQELASMLDVSLREGADLRREVAELRRVIALLQRQVAEEQSAAAASRQAAERAANSVAAAAGADATRARFLAAAKQATFGDTQIRMLRQALTKANEDVAASRKQKDEMAVALQRALELSKLEARGRVVAEAKLQVLMGNTATASTNCTTERQDGQDGTETVMAMLQKIGQARAFTMGGAFPPGSGAAQVLP